MQPFTSETARLADQIRRAFQGDAWHGDSIKELLAGVTAATAAARPIKNAQQHLGACSAYRRLG